MQVSSRALRRFNAGFFKNNDPNRQADYEVDNPRKLDLLERMSRGESAALGEVMQFSSGSDQKALKAFCIEGPTAYQSTSEYLRGQDA